MIKNSNLVDLVRKLNDNISSVLLNIDDYSLEDLESLGNFMSEYSSIIDNIIKERKLTRVNAEKNRVVKATIKKKIDFCISDLVNSINRNDIYVNKGIYGINYNIVKIREHISICQGLLMSIEHYNSLCNDGENEFLSKVDFIEKYLNHLLFILEEDSKQNDLPNIQKIYFIV